MTSKPPVINTVQDMNELHNLEIDTPDSVSGAFPRIPSRWSLVTKTVRIGAAATGVGVQMTQKVMGTATVMALFTAGAAASATGIGLIVGGAVITIGSMTASARSAVKTSKHLKVLNALLRRAPGMPCDLIDANGKKSEKNSAEHLEVVAALAYLINKKEKKYGKKILGATPFSALASVYGFGKAIYKKVKGTKGVSRAAHANIIAKHFVTHNCALAQGIAAELYSLDEMMWMLEQDSSKVAALLGEKMKST